VRGRDLCSELIGKIDFSDYFFLLLMGEMPNDNQRFFVNALLVAIAEHGLVPSVQAARMTYAAGPEAIQGAVAAGLLGSGLGRIRQRRQICRPAPARTVEASKDRERGRLRWNASARCAPAKTAIPGFGHPQHSGGDPRANVLLKLADERGLNALHRDAAHRGKRIAGGLGTALREIRSRGEWQYGHLDR